MVNHVLPSSRHWPVFKERICSEMTDRARMGLPEHYTASDFDTELPAAMSQLRSASTERLLAIISDSEQSTALRLASGNLLAIEGDPRIDAFAPDMVDIAGCTAAIGLADTEIETLLERFSGLGLDRSWIEKECPRHSVELARYRIARYPVTNFEFRTFLLATKREIIPSSWSFGRYPHELGNHPVYGITAADAIAYAQWLSQQTGRAFRLPTEAEWEFSGAGPQGNEFPWGSDFDADRANTAETGLFQTSSIGAFPGGISWSGVHDLAGNVEEYVADLYEPYPDGTYVDDHLASIHGKYHVARGGSFARFRDLARTRRRHGANPYSPVYAMGFRLAESLT